MLNKEKERVLKEDERLSMRKDNITRRKDTIKKRLEEMELELEVNRLEEAQAIVKATGNLSSSGGTFTQKDGVKKDWKKMPLNY
jgi:chaperonin cofactor prefoldin